MRSVLVLVVVALSSACSPPQLHGSYTVTYDQGQWWLFEFAQDVTREHYEIGDRVEGGNAGAFITIPIPIGTDDVAFVVEVALDWTWTRARADIRVAVIPRFFPAGRELAANDLPAIAQARADALFSEIYRAADQ